ncbi:hypothetical protein Q5H93_22315 [Hymenobacter sp. ASUV-10]|uniref:Uncharacterized protein n=1 Tax=Hymenobacter aranciens TaxID=3063996 RepID=A0ABT9BGU7_9BACT|nr:hypothetical protein [Hymenobacter sp. ASUV-10]MDO7877490.1 hypothetical protein [Hymenobacter sp. ASUV-10]
MKIIALTAALVALLTSVAPAQTARIAHLSHSGSLTALDAAADNFGTRPMPPYFVADSVRLLSDTTAIQYGHWSRASKERSEEKTHIVRLATADDQGLATKRSTVNYYQRYRPEVKLIGFDSTTKPAAPAPVLKKQKARRKKAALYPAVPAPPQHPGVGLAVAAILLFAGAGWLLGERRPGPQSQAA